MPEKIFFYSKSKEYGWLSNFYPAPFIYNDFVYKTSEHFYQSHKTENPLVQEWIRNSPNPFLAMKAGRSLRTKDGLVGDWDSVKDGIMSLALILKFENPEMRRLLLNTGDAELHEDSPTDKYWGWYGGKGKDRLGQLLMSVRKYYGVVSTDEERD